MLEKMGRFLHRRRISTLAVILIPMSGAAIYGLVVFGLLNGGSNGVDNSESARAPQAGPDGRGE